MLSRAFQNNVNLHQKLNCLVFSSVDVPFGNNLRTSPYFSDFDGVPSFDELWAEVVLDRPIPHLLCGKRLQGIYNPILIIMIAKWQMSLLLRRITRAL